MTRTRIGTSDLLPIAAARRFREPCVCTVVLMMLLTTLAGCGGGYAIEGRVVRGTLGMVTLVDADDSMLDANGIAGAQIRVIRDPGRLTREEVASTVSDSNGRFTVRINTFGAGLTNEEWLFIVRRPGTTGAEGAFRLPSRPERHRIAVALATGTPSDDNERWSSTSEDLMRDFDRFR